jgi:cardiolipin synthase (CMP-forming)
MSSTGGANSVKICPVQGGVLRAVFECGAAPSGYTRAEMPSWVNLPNCLTLARLLLAPWVIAAIVSGRAVPAFALFAVAAVTDILDGAAARRLGAGTKAGAYLDPIADKCLLSGVFLALAAVHRVPWWIVGIIFGRDVYIVLAALAMMRLTNVRSFPPSVWGKLSTFAQIATVALWMGRDLFQLEVLDALSTAMLWVCAALAVWSGLHYTWRGVQIATLRRNTAGVR